MTNLHDLAPSYVKDALSEDELRVFKEHLAECASCQEDIALLGGRREKGRHRAVRLEGGSWLQFVVMVAAAAAVVYGLWLFLS